MCGDKESSSVLVLVRGSTEEALKASADIAIFSNTAHVSNIFVCSLCVVFVGLLLGSLWRGGGRGLYHDALAEERTILRAYY